MVFPACLGWGLRQSNESGRDVKGEDLCWCPQEMRVGRQGRLPQVFRCRTAVEAGGLDLEEQKKKKGRGIYSFLLF